ncbi:hypothetical protein PUMCH_002485 [Australozyma saopauloensis]|uniref:Required for respiratory growth protein 9, mitochondrial n=1 Tax=Australozyma saopauloensis TaxID=291208 RepID=A0AAX4H9F5_9ASCO|nr:hypothetical protein PUMCH_002485 [[Candida] saopauloensis]
MISRFRQGLQLLFRRSNSTKPTGEEVFKQKLALAEKAAKERLPEWEKREEALRKRYGHWNPTHKLSRQQMVDIREFKKAAPHLKTVQIADHFRVNPESIRRILKSKWTPKEKELENILERAEKRKQKSNERKRLSKSELLGTFGQLGPQKPGNNWQHKKHHAYSSRRNGNDPRKSSPRDNKPYTDTIGDLLD